MTHKQPPIELLACYTKCIKRWRVNAPMLDIADELSSLCNAKPTEAQLAKVLVSAINYLRVNPQLLPDEIKLMPGMANLQNWRIEPIASHCLWRCTYDGERITLAQLMDTHWGYQND